MSLLFAACAVDDVETESSADHELSLAVGPDEVDTEGSCDQAFSPASETTAEGEDVPVGELVGNVTTLAGHYCVDQSSAAAQRIDCSVFMCPGGTPPWNTRLSRNHPVRYHSCVGATYVNVHSLWTGSCYTMRRDALRPC
ncbi:MAG: hypothetical protein WKG01_23250 [Kofleriaceae bacterium]